MTNRFLGHLLSILVALVAGVYFLTYAGKHVGNLPQVLWSTTTGSLLCISILAWVGVNFLGALVWQRLLHDLGYRLEWRTALTIFGIAQAGKYLPGNIGHHLGRVILAKHAGVPATLTVQTMFIEFAWSIGIAAAIALIGSMGLGGVDLPPILLALLIATSMVAPWVGTKFAYRLFPSVMARITQGNPLAPAHFQVMAAISIIYLVTFLTVGLILDLQARFLFGTADGHLLALTVAFAWSWLAGYVTPGAPAGLGVREAVLVSSVTPILGPGTAVALTISLRIATTLGDGAMFLLALAMRRLGTNGDSQSAGPAPG